MLESACLEVRVLPWRPRRRVMKVEDLREVSAELVGGSTDPTDFAISLGLWLAIVIAAPLIVLMLAAGLFSVELPLVLAIAVLLAVLRFAGVIPWTVLTVDAVSGTETRSSYRSLLRAVRRVREINHDRRVQVRWSWL